MSFGKKGSDSHIPAYWQREQSGAIWENPTLTSTVVAGTGRFHHEFQRSEVAGARDPEVYYRLDNGLFDYGLVARSETERKLQPSQNQHVQFNVNILASRAQRR